MISLLHQVLSESAAKHPDNTALIYKDETVSYAELEQESNRLAALLMQLGVRRGDRIGICMNRCPDAIAAVFGILKSGAAYVPLDPACPAERLRFIMKTCGIRVLLTAREKLSVIGQALPEDGSLLRVIVADGPFSAMRHLGSAEVLDWHRVRQTMPAGQVRVHMIDSDVAYILFTSGSTGKPKGVTITHLNSLTFVHSAHDFFGVSSFDRFSNICPLHFDMSVFDLFVSLKAGAAMAIIPETTAVFPSMLAEFITHNRISVWNSVPSVLSLLAAHRNLGLHDLSSLRLVLFAGEVFPGKYLKRIREAVPGARLCNMYGQTEANSSLYYWLDGPTPEGSALPIGRPLPNFDVFALDEQGNQVTEPGQEGELYVRSTSVALGYWSDPERTDQAFVRDPLRPGTRQTVYRTGDLVVLGSDGNFMFRGRKDHMIKSRGYRIEINEIETILCNHPQIRHAAVIPIPDPLIGNRITAIVVPMLPGAVGKNEVARHCAAFLPRYMVPEHIEIREALPTTSSGKIDRKKIGEELACA